MNILIISSPDPYKTSGVVALDIFNGLKNNKQNNIKLLSKFCNTPNEDVISYLSKFQNFKNRAFNKIKRILNIDKFKNPVATDRQYHVQDLDQTITYYSTQKLLKKCRIKPDVIIVLFMQNFISYKNIYELNKMTGAPIYLYPMDMAPFTGGCHYAWDCIGYQKQCGNCPAIYSSNATDQTNINHSYKLEYMQKTNIHLFAGNSQIADQIKSSTIFKNKKIIEGIYPVPNKNIFKSLPKKDVRNFFDIDQDAIVLFFGSVSLNEKRKGMLILIQSLNMVYKKLIESGYNTNKITLLVAGNNSSNQLNEIAFNIKHLGFISDYSLLAKAYNAADYFICPSIEEAGPTMVLQSILCKTPTISFNIGFTIDFIKDKINGFVAIEKNEITLSNCIYDAINTNKEDRKTILNNLEATSNQIDENVILAKIQAAISTK